MLLGFEIDIILLSLANLCSHLVEEMEHLWQLIGRHLSKHLICLDQHLVARENGRILVPLDMHGRSATTHLSMIHHIIVEQSEIMEYLQSQCSRQNILIVAIK